METQTFESHKAFVPWNKGKVTGQKPPLKPREVWAIRVRLQISNRVRDLALFNLAIDSKLRGCDLVHLRVEDVIQGDQVRTRALVSQRKTGAPVQFEITEQARAAIASTAMLSLTGDRDVDRQDARDVITGPLRPICRIRIPGIEPTQVVAHGLMLADPAIVRARGDPEHRFTSGMESVNVFNGVGSRTMLATHE